MWTDWTLLAVIVSIGVFPWLLVGTIEVVRYRFLTHEAHRLIEWILVVLTLVGGALLLHWIPRLGELWAKVVP